MNTKFKIGIVGCGKVGGVLGASFMQAGHEIVGVYTCSENNIERAQVLMPDVPILDIEQTVRASEIVFFTIPDDELAPTISGLAKLGVFKQGQILVHTSGATTLEVFAPATQQGVIPMSIHPVMTFTGTSLDIAKLKNASFAINAPKLMIPIAQALVLELGAEPIEVPDENRGLYHAGLSHGANHMVTVLTQSMHMLQEAGIENPESVVRPLFEAALERALMQKAKGISGPVPRGDLDTIRKHLSALSKYNMTDIAQTYAMLTLETAKLCRENAVISGEKYDKIFELIKKFMGDSNSDCCRN